MSTKKQTPKQMPLPSIVEVKLSELVVDYSLSGRSEKEIRDNAKLLKPMMESFGSWDMEQPGVFFIRNGKKHLLAGFTRYTASKEIGLKIGFFIETSDDANKLRTACIRTNAGKPISPFEQGRIYAAMRDGSDVDSLPVGAVILQPMKMQEIADEVGYTRQHVEACIGIFEETPEIAELLQSGEVSTTIVKRAKELVKDDRKRLSFLKAAVKAAKAEGKETATMRHLDAVRPDFAPLKAAKGGDEPCLSNDATAPSDTAAITATMPIPAQHLGSAAPEQSDPESAADQSEMTMDSTMSPNEPAAKKGGAQRAMFASAINEWAEECTVAFTDDDREILLDKLVDAKLPF